MPCLMGEEMKGASTTLLTDHKSLEAILRFHNNFDYKVRISNFWIKNSLKRNKPHGEH